MKQETKEKQLEPQEQWNEANRAIDQMVKRFPDAIVSDELVDAPDKPTRPQPSLFD